MKKIFFIAFISLILSSNLNAIDINFDFNPIEDRITEYVDKSINKAEKVINNLVDKLEKKITSIFNEKTNQFENFANQAINKYSDRLNEVFTTRSNEFATTIEKKIDEMLANAEG